MDRNSLRQITLKIRQQGAILILTLSIISLLPGCGQVVITTNEEVTSTPMPTPYSSLSAPSEGHDLAILGIELNPPLRYNEVLTTGRLALLVAVENRGTYLERDIPVEARLLGVSESDEILRRTTHLDVIAPGEVKIARFEILRLLPYRPTYTLVVTVLPLPEETHLSDNQRTYRFRVILPNMDERFLAPSTPLPEP